MAARFSRLDITMYRSPQRSFRSLFSGLALVSGITAGAALLGLVPTPAWAQGRLDGPAQGKIDEAINVHYLATDFTKAEQLLTGTVNACGNQCSASIIAKAWMYVGIVRGAGNLDLRGAKEAFKNALAVYPGVALDNDLATPEVQAAFAEAKGQGGTAPVTLTPTPADPAPVPEAPPPPPPVNYPPMQCEPKVQEVQTRRPVPVSCVSQYPGVSKSTLYVRPFGEQTFTRVPMKRAGNAWQAEVPCSATGMGSAVSWYVDATDAKGTRLDGYGTMDGPLDVMLNDATTEPPPHFPGKPAPDRCPDLADCPPEMLGTPACPGTQKPGAVAGETSGGSKGWGDPCEEHSECQSGLACLNDTCETAPSCATDAECDDGRCDLGTGTCAYGEEAASESVSTGAGPKNMVAITFGLDLPAISGSDVCDPGQNPDFRCYYQDKPYDLATDGNGVPLTQYTLPDGSLERRYWDGGAASGFGMGTLRILLAYDMMVTDMISGGVNAGIGISPIPDAGLSLHIDGHAKYWFTGNGRGLKPFAALGLGFGRVDASATVQAVETAYEDSGYRRKQGTPASAAAKTAPDGLANGTAFSNGDCSVPSELMNPAFINEFCEVPVKATRSYGNLFVGLGVGAWFNLGGHGPQIELYGKLLLPETGVSIQPAVSYIYGF